MRVLILNVLAYLRASYWFIPLIMAVAAMGLALGVTMFDHWLGTEWPRNTSWIMMNQPAGARAVLATIAGSIITVAGVTFSLTVMAVSFAIGQLGPRLIHNFMRDRVNQVTLGTFIATFLYCLLVLRTVLSANEDVSSAAFVPHIAIFVAIILVILNIFILIFYIHHIAEALNVYNILAILGNELNSKIDSCYLMSQVEKKVTSQKKIAANFYKKGSYLFSKENGYVRVLDEDAMLKLAIEKNCIIEIKCQPGDFVTELTPLVYINKMVDEQFKNKCISNFAIGAERDQNQDIYFISDEIAEIIARALSPSVNDPFTAITAIDWLQSAFEKFSLKRQNAFYQYDHNNELRIIIYPVTLTLFVDRVIGQIQPYVSGDRNSALHMMRSFKSMISQSKNEEFIKLIYSHMAQFYILAEKKMSAKKDKKILSTIYAEIKQLYKKAGKKIINAHDINNHQ